LEKNLKMKIWFTVILFVPLLSHSELIHSWDFQGSSHIDEVPKSNIEMLVSYGDPVPANSMLFDSVLFSDSDIGQSFTTTPSSSFGCRVFIDHLTNGIDEYLFQGTSAQGYSFSESFLFGSSPSSLNNIDFTGYDISYLSFTVDDVVPEIIDFGTPLYQIHLKGTFSVYGTAVPEPNSIALVFLGTGLFYLRRKKISNQRVDPTVKTPVESGKEQGTAGHP
jgi:hypothetical protein